MCCTESAPGHILLCLPADVKLEYFVHATGFWAWRAPDHGACGDGTLIVGQEKSLYPNPTAVDAGLSGISTTHTQATSQDKKQEGLPLYWAMVLQYGVPFLADSSFTNPGQMLGIIS